MYIPQYYTNITRCRPNWT